MSDEPTGHADSNDGNGNANGGSNGGAGITVEGAERPAPVALELRCLPEIGSFFMTAGTIVATAPRGHGNPVLVLPGFTAGDTSTAPLRATLRLLGHRPHGWSIGSNVGPADHVVARLRDLVTELYVTHGRPIDIVGWSLGGIFARIIASNQPHRVRQVITLGSPIHMGTHQSNVSHLFRRLGQLWGYDQGPRQLDLDPIPVPSTAVWTRTDGVVPGLACRQTPGPTAENVEVRGSHCGLGVNPTAIWVVADRLAQPDGVWEPFKPPGRLAWAYPHHDEDTTTAVAPGRDD